MYQFKVGDKILFLENGEDSGIIDQIIAESDGKFTVRTIHCLTNKKIVGMEFTESVDSMYWNLYRYLTPLEELL